MNLKMLTLFFLIMYAVKSNAEKDEAFKESAARITDELETLETFMRNRAIEKALAENKITIGQIESRLKELREIASKNLQPKQTRSVKFASSLQELTTSFANSKKGSLKYIWEN